MEASDSFVSAEGFSLGEMSGSGSIAPSLANGVNASGRVPANSAELVGSQFVSQFYTVLHSSPNFLYRFYTDESTVTHADGGTETEPPSSVTVATQRHISERVQAMGFQEATTEIWSVDSQYSKDNGVMVLVTGSLQCKGKKKRDFVQSFFLAVQEKGYFVLNDTFRYLSVNHSRQSQAPKENGYHQGNYDKPYTQGAYHQQSYYPAPAQPHNPQQSASSIYSSHPAAAGYSSSLPHTASSQPRADITRGHAVTPSILPSRGAPQNPKPMGPYPHTAQPPQPPAASAANPPEAAQLHTTPSDAGQTAAAAPGQVSAAALPPVEKPKPEAASKALAVETEPLPPVTQPKAVAKPEAKEAKADRPSPAVEQAPAKEPESSAPSAPLTYADRLKLGSRSSAPKTAAAPSPVVPAANATPAATSPKVVPQKEAEPVVEALSTAEIPEASTTAVNGGVMPLPEEVLTTSIFVRNLPEGTTQEKLEEAFARFGNIKSVSLRQQPKAKGDFAFVEFEEVAAMQAAIEAKVIIDGKTVTVMERKPMISKHSRAPFQGGERGGRGEGRGFRGGRDGRGRGGRGEGRPFTGGRTDRGEGREGGSGRGNRSFSSNFNGEPRLEGSKPSFEGRPEGGRGRGEGRGRGRNVNRQPPPQSRPEQA